MADRVQPLSPAVRWGGGLALALVAALTLGTSAALLTRAEPGRGLGPAEWAALRFTVVQALLSAALNGSLNGVEFRRDTNFGFEVPVSVPGIDDTLLNPRQTWADPAAYDAQARKLVKMFSDNFAQYVDKVDADVNQAAIG